MNSKIRILIENWERKKVHYNENSVEYKIYNNCIKDLEKCLENSFIKHYGVTASLVY